MRLILDEDEDAVRAGLRLQCERMFPLDGVPINAEDLDWSVVEDAGWFDLGEPRSGGGLGLLGWTLLAREIERNNGPACLLPTVLALATARDAGWRDLVGRIRSGSLPCGWWSDGPDVPGGQPRVDGGRVGLGLRMSGTAIELIEIAEHVAPAAALTARESAWLVRARMVHSLGDDHAEAGPARLWTLMAAAMSGIAEVTTERSVAYAGMREQFGRPIGAFQAVAHRCADMAVRSLVSWHQTAYAAVAFDELPEQRVAEAAAARLLASDAAVRNAAANIQNHGGIGFSSEAAEHRFLRRAQLLAHVAGGAAPAGEELVTAVGATA